MSDSNEAMWPRSDVQAATSPAHRIAPPKDSLGALRASGAGRQGQAAAAKSESVATLSRDIGAVVRSRRADFLPKLLVNVSTVFVTLLSHQK